MQGSARIAAVLTLLLCCLPVSVAQGQSLGIELHNTLNPASGGMAGASLARPQDVQSAINANPATLTQFKGTQFSFGGGWVESTYNLGYDGSRPALNAVGLSEFAGKSGAPGAVLGNIGVTQDLSALGLPVTVGIGLISSSGASAEWRALSGSNGTTVSLTVLDMVSSVGVDMTDRLSAGASLSLGTGFLDGPWVGLTGNSTAYGLRGRFGLDYELTCATTVGLYYQTQQHFTFEDNVRFPIPGPAGDVYLDTNVELPQNFGVGIANRRLMDGKLLIAAGLLYKQWENADLFSSLYDNQLAVQLGSQYTMGKVRLRLGYAWAENPLADYSGSSAGGVSPPGGRPLIEYTQALLAVSNQHRLTGGIGVVDVLPGIDLDLFAGGMFESSQDFAGGSVTASLESYWVGAGMTWRFNRGACESGPWCDSMTQCTE
jgi:long-chain fatty acid transport protein